MSISPGMTISPGLTVTSTNDAPQPAAPRRRSTTALTLALRKINPSAIDIKYGFQIAFNLSRRSVPSDCTRITDLGVVNGQDQSQVPVARRTCRPSSSVSGGQGDLSDGDVGDRPGGNNSTVAFSYLDESKRNHHCVVTMSNFQRNPPGGKHNEPYLHCFWCRHAFHNAPVGCPIRYYAHRLLKTYYSEVSRDTFCLRENVSRGQLDRNRTALEEQSTLLKILPKDYYSYDGIFCSFQCAYAFIKDNKSNPLYTDSEHLLLQLYHDTIGADVPSLEPAPSWRLLKTYGGHMTIDEFRKNFYKMEYHAMDNILDPKRVHARPVGFVFEKQVHI